MWLTRSYKKEYGDLHLRKRRVHQYINSRYSYSKLEHIT